AFGQLMQLLENNKFDTRLRELMIMRIGWATGSAYEWTNHWRGAATGGVPPPEILAGRDRRESARFESAGKERLVRPPQGRWRPPTSVSPAIPFRMQPGPTWQNTSPSRDSR